MGCSLNFEGHKSTPVHCAAYFGHMKILGLLIKYKVPINVKNGDNTLPIDDCANDEIRQFFMGKTKN